jgi:SAM-dependent methyltransferase
MENVSLLILNFTKEWMKMNKDHDSPARLSNNRNKPLCVFYTTYYEGFLNSHYGKNPGLETAPYETQKQSLLNSFFGDSDCYSRGLKNAGWRAYDFISNCGPLQQAWAMENGISGNGPNIVIEQIRRLKPEVVYLHNMGMGTRAFLSVIRPHVKIIAGQIACPVFPKADLKGFDIIFSSFPHFVENFRNSGVTSYYQPLAFDPRILEKLEAGKRRYPVTFVGGISAIHEKGRDNLEKLSQLVPVDFWGYGAGCLPENSPIRSRHHGEAWGFDMFNILRRSLLTLNRHVDVAADYANNMRLFEATGCGAMLITDYKYNLDELFEIGTEVAAYRSPEECAALIKYYLKHPEEAAAIAKAGQQRTLRDHTYMTRMAHTAEILERHLRLKHENQRLPVPDMSKISYGYTPIKKEEITDNMTSAWKDRTIPIKQRALVHTELKKMYKGQYNTAHLALAECLKMHCFPGCSILEIGCAGGYYYEILEYLLCRRLAYTGVDYSEALIRMAKDYYPGASFQVADGARLPYKTASFYIAVSSGILPHIPNYSEHIKETARVADRFVILHRMPLARNKPTHYFKKYAYGVETVELVYNQNEVTREFMSHGLKLIGFYKYNALSGRDRYDASFVFEKSSRHNMEKNRSGTVRAAS